MKEWINYHNYCLISIFLVIIKDVSYTNYTRVFFFWKILSWVLCYIIVKDSSNKWRYQINSSFSTCYSLCKWEDKSEIAIDFFFFKSFSSLNSFPCRSNFDQDSFFRDSCFLIELNYSLGLLKKGENYKYDCKIFYF